jgi:hypothetical protein
MNEGKDRKRRKGKDDEIVEQAETDVATRGGEAKNEVRRGVDNSPQEKDYSSAHRAEAQPLLPVAATR